MNPIVFILIVQFICVVTGDGSIPSFITSCDYEVNYEKCVAERIQTAIPQFTKGIPGLNVQPLDPVNLDNIFIQGNGLNMSFNHGKISGLGSSKLTKFKLVPDVELELAFVSKKIVLRSVYDMQGKILILPIEGHGDGTILVDDLFIDLRAKISYVYDSKGQHIKLVSPNFSYKMKKASFKLDNLFNGNKQLGDTTLQFLNDNWAIVMDDMAPTVIKQTVRTCVKAINNFFAAVDIHEIIENYKPSF